MPSPPRQAAFTLVELLTVISIIALLVALLMPSLGRALELSRRAQCSTNLHGLGRAVSTYSSESNEQLPTLYRTSTAFTTYFMRATGVGEVNLGLLMALDTDAPRKEFYYCPSHSRATKNSLSLNGPDNPWDSAHFRSSYPARLIEVDGQPMPASTLTGWTTLDYGSKNVIYSDFVGVDGFQGGGIVQGTIQAPHEGEGYMRMFGDGHVKWCTPGPLTKEITATAPTPEEQVAYYKELDERP